MLNLRGPLGAVARADVGNDVSELRGAIRLRLAVDEDSDRLVEFANAIGLGVELQLGLEGDLEKARRISSSVKSVRSAARRLVISGSSA